AVGEPEAAVLRVVVGLAGDLLDRPMSDEELAARREDGIEVRLVRPRRRIVPRESPPVDEDLNVRAVAFELDARARLERRRRQQRARTGYPGREIADPPRDPNAARA